MHKFFSLLLIILLFCSLLFSQQGKQQQITISQNIVSNGTDFVTDSFTETSDTLLASHTGELGATWTEHPDAVYGDITNVDGATDRIFPTSNPSAFFASGVPPNANYYVQADFFAHTNIAVNNGVCGRIDTTANTMYCLRYDAGTQWQIRKILAGVQSTLASSTSELITLGTSKPGRLIMNGSSISASINNGAITIGPITDTSITAAGRAGVRSAGGASSTTGFHLDNFSARAL